MPGTLNDIGWGFGIRSAPGARISDAGQSRTLRRPRSAATDGPAYTAGLVQRPRRGHDDNPHDPAGARADRAADPLRLLDRRLPGHRRLTMRDPLLLML